MALAKAARAGEGTPVPPDDFAEDVLIETANLEEDDTHVPGTIFISTALGSHGPRVKWYPGRPGRTLPCLVMSIGPRPEVRHDDLWETVKRSVLRRLETWVALNHVALLAFWDDGASWNRREVTAFIEALKPASD